MKLVFNKIIPFSGFMALTFFNIIFIRKEYKDLQNKPFFKIMLNRESIHWEQCKETGFIFFYLFYLLEWFVKCIISLFTGFKVKAYRSISFEQETKVHPDI